MKKKITKGLTILKSVDYKEYELKVFKTKLEDGRFDYIGKLYHPKLEEPLFLFGKKYKNKDILVKDFKMI